MAAAAGPNFKVITLLCAKNNNIELKVIEALALRKLCVITPGVSSRAYQKLT